MSLPPRLVIAGTHSGVGKTTVATGLMAAFTAAGRRVASAKVGPDYIDPGYHSVATGRPGRNLDPWMCGEEAIPGLAEAAARGADLLVVEGVMGLFDGSAEHGSAAFSSTAHVARLLDAPVVLVVDAAAMSGSVAALVHGFTTFDPRVGAAGVVLNRVASDRHERMLRDALRPLGVPVLGVLRRDEAFSWRDRHLGLVPVAEGVGEVRASVARLAAAIESGCDLPMLEAIARRARPLHAPPPPAPAPVAGGPVPVAVAAGAAFSFCYPDNLEALAAAGAELIPFDPLHDPRLPLEARGLVAGGGFPEVFAGRLADNRPLLEDVRRRVGAGLATWAECGGLLWLGRSIDGAAMVGALPCEAAMTDRLTLGYREATIRDRSPLGAPGTRVRGHEFHYSTTEPAGDALDPVGGFAAPRLLASYLHAHLGAAPRLAEAFVASCAREARP